MALLSLFTQTKARIGIIELDCSLQETHERTATLTQSPVESGATISDNVVLMPKRLTIEGIISKTPLGAAGLVGSALTAGAGFAGNAAAAKAGQNAALAKAAVTAGIASIGGLVSSSLMSPSGILSRDPVDVFKALEEIWFNRIPFTVVTALTGGGSSAVSGIAASLGISGPTDAIYASMVMTSLTVPRNKETINAIRFTATLEQVLVVAAADFAGIGPSVFPGASPVSALGKQATTAPSAGAAASADSFFVQAGLPGA